MSYLETIKDGVKYVEADGRMSRVRYRESCGEKRKLFDISRKSFHNYEKSHKTT